MTKINGLVGLRPAGEKIGGITCPPYDVIKPGTKLEAVLQAEEDSLYHITLGSDPVGTLRRLLGEGALQPDEEPSFYVYEQKYGEETRTGVLTATQVSEYAQGEIIRHEKTFDDKVKGRLELRGKTGFTFEPVFLLTRASLAPVFAQIKDKYAPAYEFTSDFQDASELHGIKNRIFRVPEESAEGRGLMALVAEGPLYIADGHHRYHASLLNRQTHCLAYICEAGAARIQAYNRVIKGVVPFAEIKDNLPLQAAHEFSTPPKHCFSLYSKFGACFLPAQTVPDDCIGRLDCSILEKELYPLLGLKHEMIMDSRHFDYYPESQLDKMKECVDTGKYDLAVALHPVDIAELTAVADAGIKDFSIVMPEKSTFFAPKILSGIFIYKHKII